MSLVPKRTPIVWNVVNWIFITLKTRRISQLLSGFTVVVWKAEINLFPKELREQGFAVVTVNYRLSPKAKNPAYIEDAAEAVAWVFKNIEEVWWS